MAKKKVVKKVIKKVAKKKAVKKTAQAKKHKKAKVCVHYDCGMPNHLTIRGEGANLSWDKGHKMKNEKADEWSFEIISTDPEVEFKVLLNDQIFELGDNHTLRLGDVIKIHPKFD